MSTSASGGAAFNPMVRKQDNAPAPVPEDDRAEQARDSNEADTGQPTGEDGS
jgi:hypothetical protein